MYKKLLLFILVLNIFNSQAQNVGIGTSSPNYKTHIFGNVNAGSAELLKLHNNNTGTGTAAHIKFTLSSDANLHNAAIEAIRTNSPASHATALVFKTCPGGCSTETNMAERFRIDPEGNIGIGTASPSFKLDVAGTARFTGQVSVPVTPTANAHAASKKYVDDKIIGAVGGSDDWDKTGNDIYNNNTGKVGVGTNSPSTQFHVEGKGAGDGTWVEGILISNTNATTGEPTLAFQNSATGANYWYTGLNQNSRYDIGYGTSFTDAGIKMTIQNTGNIGIGTASPSFKLDVAGTARFTGQVTVPVTPTAAAHAASKQYVDDIVGAVTETDPTWSGTANSTASVGRTGNVGVGTNSPANTLDVRGKSNFGNAFAPAVANTENIINIVAGSNATGNANGIKFYENTGGFGMSFGYDGVGSGAANALRFYNDADNPIFTIENGGEVGIGVTAPSYALHVSGRIKSNGINETSDIRFKKNVATLENSLDKILELRGVSYDWRQDEFPDMKFKDGKDLGVIAQEIEEIFPEVVSTDNEGYKSVQYSHLVPVLIEAMKEQQQIINAKNRELQDVQAEMNGLKAEVSEIRELLEMSTKK